MFPPLFCPYLPSANDAWPLAARPVVPQDRELPPHGVAVSQVLWALAIGPVGTLYLGFCSRVTDWVWGPWS
jgi:hypothetical protein